MSRPKRYAYHRKFGKSVKKIREAKGLTQLQLAVKSEVETTTISRIENGRTNVTLKTIITLARALKVTPKEFF